MSFESFLKKMHKWEENSRGKIKEAQRVWNRINKDANNIVCVMIHLIFNLSHQIHYFMDFYINYPAISN